MASRKRAKAKRTRRKRVLDAYRVDVSRALSRVLGAAAALVLLGSVITGSALVSARLEGVRVVMGPAARFAHVASQAAPSVSPSGFSLGLGALGISLVLAGAATAILGLRRVLEIERYVLLRSDGAVFVRGRTKRIVKWQDVEEVRHEDGELVFICHDGRSLTVDEQYGGVSVPELARRVAQLRRKALFGLLG